MTSASLKKRNFPPIDLLSTSWISVHNTHPRLFTSSVWPTASYSFTLPHHYLYVPEKIFDNFLHPLLPYFPILCSVITSNSLLPRGNVASWYVLLAFYGGIIFLQTANGVILIENHISDEYLLSYITMPSLLPACLLYRLLC